MAKIGEGDSRWIVSHRKDGTNVDNWHWTEKDLFPWCQSQFESVFKNVAIPSTKANIKIDKAESVKGNMIVCNRKNKTIFVFDIQLNLEWSGKIMEKIGDEEISGKGTISVINIANDEDKWKWTLKIDNENTTNKPLKEEAQNNVGSVIDNIVNNVLEEMKAKIQEEGGKTSTTNLGESPSKPTSEKKTLLISTPTSSTSTSSKISTKTFTQKISFEIPPNILYETLLDQNRVSAFTGGPTKVENKNGGEFLLFDGAVEGTQVELVPPKKIVQKWRFQTWPENHFSNVTFSFEESSGTTLLTLTQKDIPSSDYDRTCEGWETFFWQRIRGLFGWSYKIK